MVESLTVKFQVVLVINLTLITTSILFNAMVLAILFFRRRKLTEMPVVFLRNLFISQILISLFSIVTEVDIRFNNSHLHQMSLLTTFLYDSLLACTNFCHVAINIERYLLIRRPLKHAIIMNQKLIVTVSTLTFVLPICILVVLLVTQYLWKKDPVCITGPITLTSMGIASVILITTNCYIYIIVLRHKQKIGPPPTTISANETYHKTSKNVDIHSIVRSPLQPVSQSHKRKITPLTAATAKHLETSTSKTSNDKALLFLRTRPVYEETTQETITKTHLSFDSSRTQRRSRQSTGSNRKQEVQENEENTTESCQDHDCFKKHHGAFAIFEKTAQVSEKSTTPRNNNTYTFRRLHRRIRAKTSPLSKDPVEDISHSTVNIEQNSTATIMPRKSIKKRVKFSKHLVNHLHIYKNTSEETPTTKRSLAPQRDICKDVKPGERSTPTPPTAMTDIPDENTASTCTRTTKKARIIRRAKHKFLIHASVLLSTSFVFCTSPDMVRIFLHLLKGVEPDATLIVLSDLFINLNFTIVPISIVVRNKKIHDEVRHTCGHFLRLFRSGRTH